MNSDKLKATAQKHAPTAAIVAATAVAVRLLSPSPGTTVVAPPEPPKLHASSLSDGQLAHNGQELRLVSCGDSRKAHVTGTDQAGQVALGAGAHGNCTVVFERPWAKPPHCEANGAKVAQVTTTDLVIEHVDGPVFAFSCQP